jgi:hypothetical protein
MRRVLVTMLVSTMGLTAGCGDDNGKPALDAGEDLAAADGPAADGPAGGDAAGPSFAGQVQPIFGASCATASCHAGSSPQAGMSLESTSAHGALVGVASAQCSTLKRVEPGDPAQSYLMQKLDGSGSCFTGSKMPPAGSITSAEVETIRSWIQSGAPNN